MASNFKITNEVRNAIVDAAAALLNGGNIQIWEGVAGTTPPTNPSDAIADDDTNYKLLAELGFNATAFGASANGTATANAITSDTNANKSGTAEFFRLRTSGNASRMQGTAGEAADSTDMTFDNKTIVAGGTVAISSMTLTQPVS